MGLGIILLWDLGVSLAGAEAFYSDDGVMPAVLAGQFRESPWIMSFHSLGASASWQTGLILVQIAAAACLLAGWRTQMAVLVSWIMLCSLQARNPAVLHGGDVVLRLMLFWSCFLPLGARWSADEMQGRRSCFAGQGGVFVMASPCLLLQTAMIYWFTAVLKWDPSWTRDGTAVYYALSADMFVQTPGVWLLGFPQVCRALTFGVWWLELLGPFLAFIPWRTGGWRLLVAASFWLLHLGLAMCLRLGPFPWLMMVAWVPFLPPGFWDRSPPLTKPAREPAGTSHRWMRGLPAQVFSLVCLIYVLLWNLRTTDRERWEPWLPASWNAAGFALRLDQYWALFAPKPLTEDGWLVLDAVCSDGSHIDLLRGGRPVTFQKPERISAEFPDVKWQKLLGNLYLAQYEKVRDPFCRLLVRRQDAQSAPGRRITEWSLIYMRELTLPHGHALRPQKVELWHGVAQPDAQRVK